MPLFDKHFGKGEAHKNRDLLLRSHTQVLERLFVPVLPNNTDDMQVFINGDLSTGEQKLQIGTNPVQHRGKISLFCFSFGRT